MAGRNIHSACRFCATAATACCSSTRFLLDARRIGVLFNFSARLFHDRYGNAVRLCAVLRTLLPNKSRAELYTMIGLQKQGRTCSSAISCIT